ncbi:XkdF-like putative serine protease domain-containing protein [Chitinophaga sancti]|uniref:XkdF-like putative serine protease domain-containing protein n=2 Tax=Chitinophaga sancti TaxID=1004 RepID=A0ABZ0XQM1_9BACT|nr:XkdF-like putative serine protease domain-containing protein [Chitinophaga sancti]WQD61450.1 XkdF-like putative serine protease domain-containing protein [Chitinophaga sancti]WQD61758.1 XkdF-like putative serine protease domain-containing protein [Chitinophaga sancti]WQG92684.1 XkdF-like putative serine protease domain-containing protein [Chitinophaga sancti]WQG92993.1 XkdF-like putative serine protease domain-containing protein [Chitinophaga sancti]
MKKDIPTYEIFIDENEDSFVSAVALVDKPAIEKNFFAFNEHTKLQFSYDDERQELIGPAMIPDIEIYRKEQNTGAEYNVFFSKETIRQIAQVFFKKNFANNTNISHTDIPAHSYIFQSYIVDDDKGIKSPKGIDVPDGSWIVGMKVTDNTVWQDIKSGKLKGFSVEGLFQFSDSQVKHDKSTTDEDLIAILKKFNSLYSKPVF